MTRKIALTLGGSLIVLLLAAGLLKSQKAPQPPEPPGLLETPAPPGMPMAETFSFSSGVWLGVRLRDLTAEKARELKLPGEYGVVVVQVEEDSAAAKAGFEKNDVILEFASERVRSAAQLQRLVRETPTGRSVPILVSRTGQTRTLNVKLESGHTLALPGINAPDFDMRSFRYGPREFTFRVNTRGASLGISGDDLTKQLADYFGVKQGKGVLVREVVVASAAEKAGLKAGDVIVKVDSQEVDSVSGLRRALPRETDEKRKVTLTIVRDRREQTLSVELESLDRPPLRRAETFNFLGVDPQELARWAAESQRQVSEQMQQYKRDLADHSADWKGEGQRHGEQYRHQMEQYQRQLKESFERERRVTLERARMTEGVI